MHVKKLTSEEIGYDPTHPLVRMCLLNPHDHDFWYERPDGTWYGYSKRKDEDPEEYFWEVDGRQMAMDFAGCEDVDDTANAD